MNVIQVLLLEDQAGEARLNQKMLEHSPTMTFRFSLCQTLKAALEALQREPFDVALLDLHVPDSHGIDTFLAIQEAAPALPAVIISGSGDEQFARSVIRSGAQDFLVKGTINSETLTRVVRYAIARKEAIREAGAPELHAESPSLLRAGSLQLDGDARIILASAFVPQLLGQNEMLEVLKQPLPAFIHSEDRASLDAALSLVWTERRSLLHSFRTARDADAKRLTGMFFPRLRHDAVVAVDALLIPSEHSVDALRAEITRSRDLLPLLDDSDIGFFVLREARFVYANTAFAEMTGRLSEELSGSEWADIIAPEDVRSTANVVESLQAEGHGARVMEVKALHRNGARIPVRFTLGSSPDRMPMIFGSMIDITEEYQRAQLGRFQTTLATQLALAEDGEDIHRIVLYALLGLEQVSFAAVYRRGSDGSFECLDRIGVDDVDEAQQDRVGAGSSQHLWIHDATPRYLGSEELDAPEPEQAQAFPRDLRSLAIVPCPDGDSFDAVVLVGSTKARHIPEHVRRMLEAVARLVGGALERSFSRPNIQQESDGHRHAERAGAGATMILRCAAESAVSLARNGHWREVLPDVLERFGAVLRVSRVILFAVTESVDGKPTLRPQSRWIDPELQEQRYRDIADPWQLDETSAATWKQDWEAGLPVCGLVSKLPVGHRTMFDQQEVRSVAMIPVSHGTSLWGILRFDHCLLPHEWTKSEIDGMAAAGALLGGAIEHGRLQRHARQVEDASKRADLIKAAFIANVSHEIRTPVNIMLGFLSLIEDACQPEARESTREYSREIRDASTRLVQTVDALLDVSRLHARDIDPVMLPIRLDKLVANCASSFARPCEERGLLLEVQNNAGDVEILGDERLLSKAFHHLLDNAVKFTDAGSVRVRLDRAEEGSCCVKISDTGIGISKEYLQQIYEPYFQADFGQDRSHEGIGLGLTLAKLFLEVHGARIEMRSRRDVGTTIEVHLPEFRS